MTTSITLVPCHTCDFVARLCRASESRGKVARWNRRCDMALRNEGWFNCDQEIIWMCFVCLLAKKRTMLKRKDAISEFSVSQDSVEPLDRWENEHRLISYFLSNTSAKKLSKRIMIVKIIASPRWDVFWDSVVVRGHARSLDITHRVPTSLPL